MNEVKKTIQPLQDGQIEHPDGLLVRIPPKAFSRRTLVKVSPTKPLPSDKSDVALTNLGVTFQMSSSYPLEKQVDVAFRVQASVAQDMEAKNGVAFVEVRSGLSSTLTAGKLTKRVENGQTAYVIETRMALPHHIGMTLSPGYLTPVTPSVYIPIPHHFKIWPLDRYVDGTCRRAGTTLIDGSCREPTPQNIYPACYPAAWAKLYGAYRLVLARNKRRLEIGTPHTPNPSPDEDGDYFSTWAMGTDPIGATPEAIRVEDWHTGERVEVREIRFPLREDIPVEEAIEERAELIKRSLQSLVGRFRIPVFMAHAGHAWNVFGVDQQGYWSHGQNPSADNLSDWCRWDRADWLENELELAADPDEQPHDWFVIKYPTNCRLKPPTKRLGSIALQGSGDTIDYIRFVELGDFPSLAWTPFISPGHPEISYLWIESAVPLDRDGRPMVRHDDTWNDALGYRVPVPDNNRGDCDCHNDEGCPRCRTRLQLPFWVNNLTKDELHRYRVDLYFWTAGRRWVSINAVPIQSLATPVGGRTFPVFPDWYPDKYELPSPGPSQEFEIQATPDTTAQAAGKKHPLNWRPMAWYIDFSRNQLEYNTVHGIKLVLVCADREGNARCVVQDVKQLWFRTCAVAVA